MTMQFKEERIYKAKIGNSGIVSETLMVFQEEKQRIEKRTIEDVSEELLRLEKAIAISKEQLQELYEKTLKEADGESAAVFEIHQMMMEGGEFKGGIQRLIEAEKVNAEYAVEAVEKKLASFFESMDDEYMSARAADIRDISGRLLGNLLGKTEGAWKQKVPFVLYAEDLLPGQLMQLDKTYLKAIVTRYGSMNSHTAILARVLGIPYLFGLSEKPEEVCQGEMVLVDGRNGEFILHPSSEHLEMAKKWLAQENEKQELLKEQKGKESITLDGKRIAIYANAGSLEEVELALENDAEGIGLFRSEFLYLERRSLPTEEEQFEIYKAVLENMDGRKTVIRTMDIGADKKVSYLNTGEEENPALGYRAIRICLTQTEIFKTQLRALFRAAVYGNLSIMYPMIISVAELEKIQKIVQEVELELSREEIEYKLPEQGIMIETPAAVMISDLLAEKMDFFSIGTNDLSQYTLAIDRQNEKLDDFFDPHHPAILRMIRMTIENAHKYGKWVGICGELGADETLTEEFVRMGVDEFSVVPSSVLKIRQIVRKISTI